MYCNIQGLTSKWRVRFLENVAYLFTKYTVYMCNLLCLYIAEDISHAMVSVGFVNEL